ncbi:XkdX family protein [Fructobacillus sp. M158]|uniref:XkdX family protein n=1 Tax=Fructobacillus parabroussonetiae TaxID=2713174 RepID=UPI00200B47CB|nr:XkdX family protein [Fructobacillus parabroussonetiae]MCK8617566.1 XkdX family protein [Fructobacillus parabroussonetiae]
MYPSLKKWFDDGILTADDLKISVPWTISQSEYQTITGIPYEEEGGDHGTA